jgi:transcriptional regulator with XRE-family HTH domain
MPELLRKGHFLGAKLRALRKANGLTLEELSVRCVQRDAAVAPSVSYLSMIESGKRAPSTPLLSLLASVFQRPPGWFLDESADLELAPAPPGEATARVPLEPAFLFSKNLLRQPSRSWRWRRAPAGASSRTCSSARTRKCRATTSRIWSAPPITSASGASRCASRT